MTDLTDSIEKGGRRLDWPEEQAGVDHLYPLWDQADSNICLDFHGDPAAAQLVVFSDGNHHMALRDCLDLFLQQNVELTHIFYATTPPGPIVNMLKSGGLQMGNLIIRVSPHVFISPPNILDKLVADGLMPEHFPFVRNQGNVLLVKKGNPKQISGVSDLMREDVRLFMSNPETEKASYTAYYDTLKAGASEQGSNRNFPDDKISQGQVFFGTRIHHREAPQAVVNGSADVAVVFYHLALRYVRIFPSFFEIVPLGGTASDPRPHPGNVVSSTHIGLIHDGGKWGEALIRFFSTAAARQIYTHHGLIPFYPVD